MMKDFPNSIEYGQKVEDLFGLLYSQQMCVDCRKSTTIENMMQHFDWVCEEMLIEVKARKKKERLGPFCDDEMLLELVGKRKIGDEYKSKPGWLFGNATHIAHELLDSFLIFNRQDLEDYYRANRLIYPIEYRKNGSIDCFVWIPIEKLKTIKHSILPKPQNPMNNYTPQPNSFSLFANDKGDNPKRPDYKGDIIMPDGTKMRLSAWIRESQGGKKYLSGKVEPMQDRQDSAPSTQKDGDDLPF